LDQMDTNYVVAMNHTQLIGDIALYCGKRVIVSVNGVASDLPLFIGDGCERCGTGSANSDSWDPTAAPGLDFSYSVLSELSSNACSDGHIDITWEIVDETLYDFDTNAPNLSEGPVSSGGNKSPTKITTTPTTATESTSNPKEPCVTGSWQCGGNALEECLDNAWVSMVTCPDGFTCQGGNQPYCAPPSRIRRHV
jgi:hypothetical protein